ncbi:hypothetical protein N0V84_000791 [Fusarium piperis]|uniref:Uncharacterized protein n=1 Tax=Fusarium piperis TaxID=1435070 RepID=A0A9W8WMT0_9HYPO|nr:hypothetical protein N0V84_000791 [Fusarium piperis]
MAPINQSKPTEESASGLSVVPGYPIKGRRHYPNSNTVWASKEDVVVFDGAEGLIHCYNDSIVATSVSRLRLEDETDIPSGGVMVAFAPYFPDENSVKYFFVAIGPNKNIFYPIVCEFENDTRYKLFLAEDPDKGAEMLKSPDLIFSLKGGKVTATPCL